MISRSDPSAPTYCYWMEMSPSSICAMPTLSRGASSKKPVYLARSGSHLKPVVPKKPKQGSANKLEARTGRNKQNKQEEAAKARKRSKPADMSALYTVKFEVPGYRTIAPAGVVPIPKISPHRVAEKNAATQTKIVTSCVIRS